MNQFRTSVYLASQYFLLIIEIALVFYCILRRERMIFLDRIIYIIIMFSISDSLIRKWNDISTCTLLMNCNQYSTYFSVNYYDTNFLLEI